jgi:hypothetical protein
MVYNHHSTHTKKDLQMNRLHITLGFLAVAFISTACTGTPTLEEEPSAEFAGLNKVSGSGFREAWARPDAGLARYKFIQISDLLSANAEIQQPSSSKRIRKDWELTPARQQALARGWRDAMIAAAGKYGINTAGNGEKVLRVDAEITRIAPSADLEQTEKASGPNTVYTEDSGEASIEIRLYDQAGNKLLGVVRDRRRIGPRMWGLASTVNASANMRNLLNTWSNQLLLRITGN